MRTRIEIDAERPEQLIQILRPSLTSDDTVQYELQSSEEGIIIDVEAEGLGALRGCSDTVFRLTTLARKLY